MTYLKSKQSVNAHLQRRRAKARKEASQYKDGLGKARKAEYDGVSNA